MGDKRYVMVHDEGRSFERSRKECTARQRPQEHARGLHDELTRLLSFYAVVGGERCFPALIVTAAERLRRGRVLEETVSKVVPWMIGEAALSNHQ